MPTSASKPSTGAVNASDARNVSGNRNALDRAEMLLAEALAFALDGRRDVSPRNPSDVAEAVAQSADWGNPTYTGSDWSAAWNGAHQMLMGHQHFCAVCSAGDEDNPDAYAAGAVLVMALES